MDKETERKRRMKRTGHWFAPAKKDKNYIFPVVLVISLICLILVRN